jgi:broad specificity phosphatase PhoE
MTDTLIDFLRHGEPRGGSRFRGNGADDPLSDRGWQQMWGAVGDRAPWQQIVSSPLRRCLDFAVALSERDAVPLSVDERFREVGFGSWEGRTRAEIIAADESEYRAFYRDPLRNRPPGAEPLESFGERVAEALAALLQAHAGKHVLVVAHAGVIRAALGFVLQADPVGWYRARVDNGAFTRILANAGGLRLEFHNRPFASPG